MDPGSPLRSVRDDRSLSGRTQRASSGQLDIRRLVAQLIDQHPDVLGIIDRHIDEMDTTALEGGLQRRQPPFDAEVTREPFAP
jgi:hypothetical protein